MKTKISQEEIATRETMLRVVLSIIPKVVYGNPIARYLAEKVRLNCEKKKDSLDMVFLFVMVSLTDSERVAYMKQVAPFCDAKMLEDIAIEIRKVLNMNFIDTLELPYLNK